MLAFLSLLGRNLRNYLILPALRWMLKLGFSDLLKGPVVTSGRKLLGALTFIRSIRMVRVLCAEGFA